MNHIFFLQKNEKKIYVYKNKEESVIIVVTYFQKTKRNQKQIKLVSKTYMLSFGSINFTNIARAFFFQPIKILASMKKIVKLVIPKGQVKVS